MTLNTVRRWHNLAIIRSRHGAEMSKAAKELYRRMTTADASWKLQQILPGDPLFPKVLPELCREGRLELAMDVVKSHYGTLVAHDRSMDAQRFAEKCLGRHWRHVVFADLFDSSTNETKGTR